MSSDPAQLRETALHAWHVAAGAKMVDFAGWSMPLEYPSGTVTEHRAVRSGCGAFDVSHMGNLWVAGREAVARLDEVLTNDVSRLAPGDVQYTLLCNERGGVVDDMMVTLVTADRAMIVPNAANTAAVSAVLAAELRPDDLVDATAETAILAVQGPRSAAVLARLGLPADHDYMTMRRATVLGSDVLVSRSGYTGEHGYELIVPADRAPLLWEELLNSPFVTPCGLGARDTLRTEMGYALHGQDISPAISPVAAMLSWAVAWGKPRFHGRAALLSLREDPAVPRLRGLLATGRGVPRPGMAVMRAGQRVGELTSGTFSPTLRRGIGLALLDRSVTPGQQVSIDVRGRELAAEVVKPPFVDSSPK